MSKDMNKLYVTIPSDLVNDLQRTQMESNNIDELILRYFDRHANDEDDSALSAPCFVSFMNQLELAKAEYMFYTDAVVKYHIPKFIKQYAEKYDWKVNFQTEDNKLQLEVNYVLQDGVDDIDFQGDIFEKRK